MRFTKLGKSQNELAEKLEQLRAIDNGIKINAIIKDYEGISIDTEQDLENLVKSLNSKAETHLSINDKNDLKIIKQNIFSCLVALCLG